MPIADFRAAYIGSRSILGGIIWLVLVAFVVVDGVDTVIVLLDRVGVERLTAGRDSSAGLMSGILAAIDDVSTVTSRPQNLRAATRQGQS